MLVVVSRQTTKSDLCKTPFRHALLSVNTLPILQSYVVTLLNCFVYVRLQLFSLSVIFLITQ